MIDNRLPFSNRLCSGTRVKKAEKRHLSDPSLACALLGATSEKLINDPETFGFLLEALCERDLKICTESMGAQLYHYQDYANNETDAVIEQPIGDWCAIEIKPGANRMDKAKRIRNRLQAEGSRTPKALCVICGLCNAAYRRTDGACAAPVTALGL